MGGSKVTAMATMSEEEYFNTAFSPVWPTNPGPTAKNRTGSK